ncbi:RNA polymerase sigma factor [Paracidobacterium acidisoli]|nr:RNA polymerase sigma factor [Paracidobacterium acidisoli]MBT9331575.1 RNA polymerase sigma factor [Paracidobacterium acidisoli]
MEAGSNLEEQILVFYREYRPRLYRYLCSLEISSDLADEIVQETFLRLTDQLQAKQNIQTLEGWVIRVAHNLAINASRKMRREMHVAPAGRGAVEQADPAQNPEQAYLEKERLLRMKAALESLNEKQRHCFLMRAQGFHYKDIGLTLGITSQRACALVKKAALRLAAICG